MHEHDVMLQDQPTAVPRERVCGAMAKMSGCVAIVLICLFGLNTVRTKSTWVSLNGCCCAELALVVTFVATLRMCFVNLAVSSSEAHEDCARLHLHLLYAKSREITTIRGETLHG